MKKKPKHCMVLWIFKQLTIITVKALKSRLDVNYIGFSLIELMISLIAISVITAAFVPVISKKIKANDIAISMSDVGSTVTKLKISTDCTEVNANCTLCDISETPAICLICSKSCSAGQTAKVNTCECIACNNSESGVANCTGACTWDARNDKAICTECQTGYYLSNGTCKKCEAGYKCPDGSSRIQCTNNTYSLAGATTCSDCTNCLTCDNTTGRCTSCNAGYYLSNSTCSLCPAGTYSEAGANNCLNCKAGCAACSSATSCTSCIAGYGYASNNCTQCNDTQYCPGGTNGISNCSNLWDNCAKCSSSACTECNSGYTIENNACVQNANTTEVNGVLWTTRNAGDIGGLNIDSLTTVSGINMKLCTVGYACSYSSGTPICYRGQTSNNCSNNDGYDGCNRTVCNWYAASKICAHYNMELPTDTEFNALGSLYSCDAGTCLNYTHKEVALCNNGSICGNTSRCTNSSNTYMPEHVQGQLQARRLYTCNLVTTGVRLDKDSKFASVRCIFKCSNITNGCIRCSSMSKCDLCSSGQPPNAQGKCNGA